VVSQRILLVHLYGLILQSLGIHFRHRGDFPSETSSKEASEIPVRFHSHEDSQIQLLQFLPALLHNPPMLCVAQL
jgi:hypothetical protein